MNVESLFKESYIFKDESKLFPEYVPSYLPFREEQLKRLIAFFKGILDPDNFAFYRAICYGPTGTGKTALTKYFGRLMVEEAKKKGLKLHFVHLNCHIERTYFMIVTKIAESLIPGVPRRGFSPKQYLTWIMDLLEEENSKLLICLDEADYAIRNDPEIFYDISRIPEMGLSKVRVSVILILRDLSSLNILGESALSTLQRNLNYFNPYMYAEIKGIIKERVEEAFMPNVVPEDVIEEIALRAGFDKGGRGDARFALELLWRAGKIAEISNSNKIQPEHLRKALEEIHPGLSIEVLSSLSEDERLILSSIARALKKNKSTSVAISELREYYILTCESKNRKPKKYTQFWSNLKSLHNKGVINMNVVNERRGRRSYISLNVPVDVIEHKLRNGEL